MIVSANETRESLLAWGVSEHDADELLRFRAMLPDIATFGKKALSPERKAEVLAYCLGDDAAAQGAEFRAAMDRSMEPPHAG